MNKKLISLERRVQLRSISWKIKNMDKLKQIVWLISGALWTSMSKTAFIKDLGLFSKFFTSYDIKHCFSIAVFIL